MLAAKYGGYLTFGALGGGKESAPGQPTLHQLRQMYRLPQLTSACQVIASTLTSTHPRTHTHNHSHSHMSCVLCRAHTMYCAWPRCEHNRQICANRFHHGSPEAAYGCISIVVGCLLHVGRHALTCCIWLQVTVPPLYSADTAFWEPKICRSSLHPVTEELH